MSTLVATDYTDHIEPTMFEIHEKLCSELIKSGYGCVNIVSMPKEINKYDFLQSTFFTGFEVHKLDSKFLQGLLDALNIHYTLSNRGKGRRNYDFFILEDEDFREIYNRLTEVPVIVGDDSL